jgi:uncharacterized phage protein (TIGR02218 family)
MKTIPATLDTHLQAEATTYTFGCKITRTDGVILGFTSHDKDVVLDGVPYTAETGFLRTAIQTISSTQTDTLDLEGILSSEDITDDDIREGRYDRAEILFFVYNWDDPQDEIAVLRRGWIGEIATEGPKYQVRIDGLKKIYEQNYGRIYSKQCIVDLGDAECKILLIPDDWQAETVYITGDIAKPTVSNGYRFRVTVPGTSDTIEPIWNTSGTTVDGTVEWAPELEQFYVDGVVDTIDDNRRKFTATGAFVTTTPLPADTWEAEEKYVVTESVLPTEGNETGLRYIADLAAGADQRPHKGESAKREPVWSTLLGDEIVDRQVVWIGNRDEWYQGGRLSWVTGNNVGLSAEVRRFIITQIEDPENPGEFLDVFTFHLFLPMYRDIQIGDTFRVTAGCDKHRSTCQLKFDNLVNFRGVPFVPGISQILDTPDGKTIDDVLDD